MDKSQKIKHIIVEAIGNPEGRPGKWVAISFSRITAEQIADTIYQKLESNGLLAKE